MFGKKQVVEETPIQVETKPESVTVIAEGVTLVGDFETHDPVKIYGALQGSILSDKKISVFKDGEILGNGLANQMHIEGNVEGEFKCVDCVHLTATGVMTGKLATFHLTTEDGSIFEGELSLRKPVEEKPEEIKEPVPSEEA